MENKNEEKIKKIILNLKEKIPIKNQKIRNKSNQDFELYEVNNYQTISQGKMPSLYPFYLKKNNNNNNKRYNDKNFNKNLSNLNNLNNLPKLKTEDSSNNFNDLFFTTANIIKRQKLLKGIKPVINLVNHKSNLDEKNQILSKLFPDKNEIDKYSNLPFFSFVKMKSPYKIKLDKREVLKRLPQPQEEFLYKISHDFDEEKTDNKFNKNKGIRKGTAAQYFHGVDKFCVNNKVSETNFKREDLNNKKKIKLKLNIKNFGGDKIPQMSNKERHMKILEDDIKNLKSVPNKLMSDLQDDVFKFFDEEIDNTDNEDDFLGTTFKKFREQKKNLSNSQETEDIDNNTKEECSCNNNKKKENIVNLSNQFLLNQINMNRNMLLPHHKYVKIPKNKSYYDYNDGSNNNISSIFKRPIKYPINFYTTQQLKNKEGFKGNHKNTFEKRIKKLKEEEEENERNKQTHLIFSNANILKKKEIKTNGFWYKNEDKIRDKIIATKLKYEFNPVDIKRILNGLKPWAEIKSEEGNNINIDNSKENQMNENKEKVI